MSQVILEVPLPASWLPIGAADAGNLLTNGGLEFLLKPPALMIEPLGLSAADLEPGARAFFIALPADPDVFKQRGAVAGSVAVLKCEDFDALARAVEDQKSSDRIVPHVRSGISNIGRDVCLDVEEMLAQPERTNRVVFRRWSVRMSADNSGVFFEIATVEPLLIEDVRHVQRSIVRAAVVRQVGL